MKMKYFNYGAIAEQKAYQDSKGNWIHYIRHVPGFGTPENYVTRQSPIMATYSKWLMTDEERRIYDEYDYDNENLSEWNKIADYGIRCKENAFKQGNEDRLNESPYEFKEKHNSYEAVYRAAYEGLSIKEILDKRIVDRSLIFACPWHAEGTLEYYRKNPWVSLIDYKYPEGFISRKQAVDLRGSPDKFQEYIDLINSQKAPDYPDVY